MALEQTRFTILGLNPNDVATFIVVLILSLPILLKWSKYWIWLVWPAETLLISLLVGTGSRGGTLALICGWVVLVILSWRKGLWPKKWMTWASIGLAIMLGMGAGLTAFPKGFRIGNVDVSPEASAGRRLEVWSTVPAMLASAPTGWGSGKSADAYEQWFEPLGENVALKHLLSSHLTWLVELGWQMRWLYLFSWIAAIALLIPSRTFNFPVWGVAVWTALLVALFYNAAGKWWNWPLPALWLTVALVLRFRQKTFPAWRYGILAALVSGVLVGLPFVIFGLHLSEISIRVWDGGNIILIGTGKPTVAMLGPSNKVLGNFYGQDVRKEWLKAGFRANSANSVIIIGRPDTQARDCLADCRVYVISGSEETSLKDWESSFASKPESKLVFINCQVEPDDWIKTFDHIAYYHGEFYGDPFYNEWKDFSATNSAVSVKDIPEHETYIPDWLSFVDTAAAK